VLVLLMFVIIIIIIISIILACSHLGDCVKKHDFRNIASNEECATITKTIMERYVASFTYQRRSSSQSFFLELDSVRFRFCVPFLSWYLFWSDP
jgi:hypothetical protein